MYLTQSNVIRGLSKEEYSILRETCQYSNNLYNVALYNIRQYYFQDKKFLKYEENYHVCKENENYGLLQVSSASSGDPQNERKLTPSVLSRGPGTGQRGSSWYSRV